MNATRRFYRFFKDGRLLAIVDGCRHLSDASATIGVPFCCLCTTHPAYLCLASYRAEILQ